MATNTIDGGIRIQAPVGVAEVAQTLGEASLDVGTLCRSPKINPASLVRPAWSEVPNRLPEELRGTTNSIANWKGYPKTATINGVAVRYLRVNWQYVVPYFDHPDSILPVKDLHWVHADPDEDSWLNLAHFDGYRHGATPLDPVGNLIMNYYSRPSFTLFPGTLQRDAVSTDGANPGGYVCLAAVLRDNPAYPYVFLGASLYHKRSTGYVFMGYFTAGEMTDTALGNPNLPVFQQAVAGAKNLQPGMEFLIVPWAMMANFKATPPSGKTPYNTQRGAVFVPLNYNDQYRAYREVTVEGKYVIIQDSTIGPASTTATQPNIETRDIILTLFMGNKGPVGNIATDPGIEIAGITIHPSLGTTQTFPLGMTMDFSMRQRIVTLSVRFPKGQSSFTGTINYNVLRKNGNNIEKYPFAINFDSARRGMAGMGEFDLTDPYYDPENP